MPYRLVRRTSQKMTTEASSELDRTGRYAWDCRRWVDGLVQYADTIRYAGRRTFGGAEQRGRTVR